MRNQVVALLLVANSFSAAADSSLAEAAIERTNHVIRYDGSYRTIAYPGGDIPADIGVCTDVVIRSYRRLGVDLQVLVHEDMLRAFDAYPKSWGLSKPDRNIDHRRVPNLRRFFERHGETLLVSDDPANYRAGDIVSWMLEGKLPHIGIVTARYAEDGSTPLVVHNVGAGPKLEDALFRYRITGHYRYAPPEPTL